jgi:hypothetical protein
MKTPTERTDAEITRLKRDWADDPCWDLEETEGFEAHHAELLAFRQMRTADWAMAERARREAWATRLGIPENLILADYLRALEQRLLSLEKNLEE